jgi:hypothetical protein
VAATTEPAASPTHDTTEYGLAPRLLLAALSIAAGVVHLVMAPVHASSSTAEAIGFATVGWLQILLAIGLLMRPSRALLQGTVLLNAAAIVVYVVSRTAGLPFGDHAGVAENVEGIDLMTAVFEGLLVVGAGILWARPKFMADLSTEAVVMASALPVVVLVATSVALADPATTEHAHGGDETESAAGGHAHGAGAGGGTDADLASIASQRCDLGLNPAAYWNETTTAGVDTIMGGEAAAHDHNAGAAVKGSPELDQLISKQVTGTGEGGDAAMVVALGQASDEVYQDWLRWLAATGAAGHTHGGGEADDGGASAAPDDNHGMGGHLGAQPWHAMTDQAQCDQLTSELALARDTALAYPTVADAEKAGWVQVTPYVPGIAAHFMNFRLVDGKFEIDKPEMILYDGTADDARVVGLSYYIIHPGTAEPTQGFTGNNDHYHRHDGLCVGAGGVIGDSTTTAEDCAARGGRKANGQAGWMSHAWVVPGCESPWGVFSGATPVLDAALGQNSTKDGGSCAGSGVRDRYDFSPGAVGNTPTTVGGSVELASGG